VARPQPARRGGQAVTVPPTVNRHGQETRRAPINQSALSHQEKPDAGRGAGRRGRRTRHNGSEAMAKSRLDSPELFINRELSWLEFNDRVSQPTPVTRTQRIQAACVFVGHAGFPYPAVVQQAMAPRFHEDGQFLGRAERQQVTAFPDLFVRQRRRPTPSRWPAVSQAPRASLPPPPLGWLHGLD